MGVERLERVLWRLRKIKTDTGRYLWYDLRRAIMHECGTDPKTYRNNKKALTVLGWIKPYRKTQFTLTDLDLTGDE